MAITEFLLNERPVSSAKARRLLVTVCDTIVDRDSIPVIGRTPGRTVWVAASGAYWTWVPGTGWVKSLTLTEVSVLQASITATQGSVTALGPPNTAMNTAISALTTQLNSLASGVTSLNSTIAANPKGILGRAVPPNPAGAPPAIPYYTTTSLTPVDVPGAAVTFTVPPSGKIVAVLSVLAGVNSFANYYIRDTANTVHGHQAWHGHGGSVTYERIVFVITLPAGTSQTLKLSHAADSSVGGSFSSIYTQRQAGGGGVYGAQGTTSLEIWVA